MTTIETIGKVENVIIGMISKCHCKTNLYWKYYGGKGVYVYGPWRRSKLAFIKWALTHGWKPDLEINRIDNNGPYIPQNINFVSHQRNLANRMQPNGRGFRGRSSHGHKTRLPMNVQKEPNGKYRVVIRREGITVSVGYYKTIAEAVKERDKAIKRVERRIYGNQC